MANRIKTFKNQNGDNILPRTVSTAVKMASGNTLDVDIGDMMLKSGGILENYSEAITNLTGTTTTIDLSLTNVFKHTLTGDTTYTFSNAINGVAHSFTLVIEQDSVTRNITMPASVKWQGGEIPGLTTANKTYVLTFMTVDGGTTWLGMFGGEF